MIIETGNLHARIIQASDDERSWLSEYLAFEDSTSHYRRKAGATDGRIRLFNIFAQTFPTGFMPMVIKAGTEEGFNVQVLDKRVEPVPPDLTADIAWLRDYQHDAVAAVEAKTRGILWMPTGSGKTEVAAALAQRFPVTWLFLVHRTTLGTQAADRYETRTKLPTGRIGEGVWNVPDDATFVCATFQTLSRLLEKADPRALALLARTEGLIVDECHVLPAASFYRVSMATPRAYWRVGLSGTPLARGDKRSLLAVGALGPVIYRLATEKLIDEGVLAKPHIRMVEVHEAIVDVNDLGDQRTDTTFARAYSRGVVKSKVRNAVVVDCASRAEKPCLVFVKEISHGKLVEKALWRAGIKTAFVWGDSAGVQRDTKVRDLIAGRIDVLVCSVIFQEGTDIPDLRSVVVASAGKSVIATLQRIGRGMRTTKDKTTFEVWDIADKGCGCRGLAHKGCKWLAKHTADRLRAYAAEGHTITIDQALTVPAMLPKKKAHYPLDESGAAK